MIVILMIVMTSNIININVCIINSNNMCVILNIININNDM